MTADRAAHIADLTASDAAYLIETVAPVAAAMIETDDEATVASGSRVVLIVPAAGISLLGDLPEDADGHLDGYSQVWIGGDVAGHIIGFAV
jgi:hypothetical protein